MAEIQNDRDVLLQAASPRVVPIPIPIENVEGLPGILDGIDQELDQLGNNVAHLMNNSNLVLRASATTVTDTGSVTMTLVRGEQDTGAVVWSLYAGSAILTPAGDTCTVTGNSITSASITVKAAIGSKEAYATISKLGVLSMQNSVNLATQVSGQLANGNVSGLGALALLNSVNLNTQTVGALNGATQVTNLGALAYANSLAANQIGAGTLAAGVIYTGSLSANQITTGTLSADRVYGGTLSGATINGTGVTAGVHLLMSNTSGTKFSASPVGTQINVSNSTAGLKVTNTAGPTLYLAPNTHIGGNMPAGTFTYHSSHGLCFSDGTRVRKVVTEIIA